MKAKTLILFLAALACAPVVGAEEQFREDALSINESKKFNAFISEVTVSPKEFEVGGHKLGINQCWLERTHLKQAVASLVLTLKIDGKPIRILPADSDDAQNYSFYEVIDGQPLFNHRTGSIDELADRNFWCPVFKQRIKDLSRMKLKSALIGSGYIENHRFALMKSPASLRVKLRVTPRIKQGAPNANLPKEDSAVLEFDLSGLTQ